MSSDAAAKLWEDSINQRLFDLVHSPHSHDKLGGILAIGARLPSWFDLKLTVLDHLLDVDGEETIEFKHNLFRFYNYVKSLLPNSDLNVMLAASKTLGQIAEIGGGAAFGEHFMDYEVSAAIGLLQGDKQEPGRYAGVLILKELARNSPGYFHSHIDLVFDKILMPIRDPRVIVREGAAELLAACLEIIAQRERQGRSAHLSKILADAQAGLKMSQPEIIHGSLLTYRELLLHGGMVSPHAL
jgi:serine/threonine-protein kinase mTOR